MRKSAKKQHQRIWLHPLFRFPVKIHPLLEGENVPLFLHPLIMLIWLSSPVVNLVKLGNLLRLAEEGIDETFYRQIRRATYGQMLRSLNSFENIAVSLTEGHFRGFDYFNFPTVFESVTKADIEDFLRRNIVPEHSAISIIRPLGIQKEN